MSADQTTAPDSMDAILERQKVAYLGDMCPSYKTRKDRLNRAIDLLVTHRSALEDAASEDFGHRSKEATAFSDIATSIRALKFARNNLRSWMKSERRDAIFPLNLLGASARVDFQPKGVVGIMSPWNFPVGMVFSPFAGAVAAGNRIMVKPSEFTPQTSQLIANLLDQAFDKDEVATFLGGPETGQAFSKLPFDHLVFTGATSIGHHIMRAAADNLTPITLELGGKSPVIIGKSASIQQAASRIMAGKVLNAGQICLAPDYVFVPQDKLDEFITEAKSAITQMHPSGILHNDDYTSIINERHYLRLKDYVEDATDKGGNILPLAPANEDFSQQPHRKIPPTLITQVNDNMKVMQDEVFGPLLPIMTYSNLDDVIAYINAHDRPLALYYFGTDKNEENKILNHTISGGVTVNDVIFHNGQEDLPFGGIGPSGMGCYHGRDGFLEFSHKKAVYRQTRLDVTKMLRPPYGKLFHSEVDRNIKN